MKTFLTALLILVSSFGLATDADAKKRLGGGKSTGMQREAVKPATPPTAAPAATPAAPMAAPAAAGAATAAAAAAKPASGMSRWLGPLAGLAAGGLLASLFMGGAFGGIKAFDILLLIGLAVGAYFLFRMFMSKKTAAAPAGGFSPNDTMQYQAQGTGGAYNPSTPPAAPAEPMQRSATPDVERQGGRIVAPEIGSGLTTANASPEVIAAATAAPRIPADFDVAPFERNARAAFIRLQAANDAADLTDIRDFTTPEMYAEISLQIQERGMTPQRTEVVSLNVRVLEVVTESERAVASVRYTGVMKEDGINDGFDEVWHVVKNLKDDKSTWRLAGIQQLDA